MKEGEQAFAIPLDRYGTVVKVIPLGALLEFPDGARKLLKNEELISEEEERADQDMAYAKSIGDDWRYSY